MAFSESDKAKIRLYMGWSPRFHQTDVALEQAMNAVDNLPEVLALIQNPIGGSPPGYIASLEALDAKIVEAQENLPADQVGSIKLNRNEMRQLYREGKRLVSRLATLLGTEVRTDIFSGRLPRTRSSHWGNYQVQG
jgi:hypothetical protein